MGAALPEPLLSGTRREVTIDFLLNGAPIVCTRADERQLLTWVLPSWQRPEVWGYERKKAFVEGIFLGLGTGYYVVHEPDWNLDGSPKPMSGWLIDGQQRISALRDFLQDKLTVFDGILFSDLDRATQRKRLLNKPFPYVSLEHGQNEQTLRDLYVRLNFGGIAHTLADLQRVRATAPMNIQATDPSLAPPSTTSKGPKP